MRAHADPGPAVRPSATTGASADNTHITKFQIDGRLKDWGGVAPVWQDAGRAKVIFPQVFDVKEVYLDNDGRYLYVSLIGPDKTYPGQMPQRIATR